MNNLFESVEDVWAMWLFSCAMLSVMVYRSLRSEHWKTLTHFFQDERGASYALAYLMTFPFYLILVCWVIQSSMILIVKIGVTHAAHTAARSAVVWRSASLRSNADGLNMAREASQHAAAVAMVPYASGLSAHQNAYLTDPLYANLRQLGKAKLEAFGYDQLFRQLAKNSEADGSAAESDFVRRKYVYAAMMTKVQLGPHKNNFNEELKVTVRFRMPIHIPGTGRVLGKTNLLGLGYYRDVIATAALPLETPETDDPRRGLGINYDSLSL